MNTQNENVLCVYDDQGQLVSIVKRDETSRKTVVYMASEARVEDIESLIKGKEPNV